MRIDIAEYGRRYRQRIDLFYTSYEAQVDWTYVFREVNGFDHTSPLAGLSRRVFIALLRDEAVPCLVYILSLKP